MNRRNEDILQELITLDAKFQKTGRKNHKRLSELQTQMLINSAETLDRAVKQTDRAFEQTDIMLRKYEQLEAVNKRLVEENTELYFACQMLDIGAPLYQC